MSALEHAVFAIYESPRDYPGRYVVRRWVGTVADPEPRAVALTLAEARKAIPSGLFYLPRLRGDDPCIKETWI